MRRSVGDVLAYLKAEGLVPDDVDEIVRAELRKGLEDHMPWYLRAAVGLGAWFATSFLIGSLFAIAVLRDETARLVFGLVLLGGAVWVRRGATSEFMKWAAVAGALAGQALVVASIAEWSESVVIASSSALLLSAAMIPLMPDWVHRFLTSVAGAGSLIVALVAAKVPLGFDVALLLLLAACIYVWRVGLTRRKDATAEMLEPVGYGLVIGLFGALLARTVATSAHRNGSMDLARDLSRELGTLGPLAAIALTVALVALVWKINDEHGASPTSGRALAAIAGAAALGLGALNSPGIIAGAAALVLAFDRRDKVLLGLATTFLIGFGSFYYYSLHLTLLEKSGVLVGSGVLLLAIRAKLVPRGEAA